MAVLVKTLDGLAYASVKTRDGLAAASIKTINGVDTTASGGFTLALTAQSLGTLRNDAGLDLGFKFTVGASPITVSALGRWVVSGNSETHDVYIRDSGGTLGTVNIDTSGAPAGAYFYATLGSPLVLSASTDYYIFSVENLLGDQWYSSDTTVTASAEITVVGARFVLAGNPENGPDGSISYVPPNFKYT